MVDEAHPVAAWYMHSPQQKTYGPDDIFPAPC